MRHEDPQTIPQDLVKLLHSDLVTGPELDRPVINFQVKKEELGKLWRMRRL
jgi:hypothetical protein